MWDLRKGRNSFLARHRFDHDHSVWWYVSRALARSVEPEDQPEFLRFNSAHAAALDWKPTASNCPGLAAVVDHVRDKLPPEWKALARNIFVGITLDPNVEAQAWNRHDAGVIEISLQYLWALDAYASAFDEFAYALSLHIDGAKDRGGALPPEGSDYGDLMAIWPRLDRGLGSWRRPDAVDPGTTELLVRLGPGRTQEEFDRYISSAQEFIVCHEIAHHVLTHTAPNARKRKVAAAALADPLFESIDPSVLQSLSKESLEEIQADVVALGIMVGEFDHPITSAKAYRALAGAVLALVTTTHVNEHWFDYDPGDSHPPLIIRLWAIFAAADAWLSALPRGERGDHPLDYAVQLRLFVESMMTHWVETQYEEVAAYNLGVDPSQHLDALQERYLEGWLQLRTRLDEHNGSRGAGVTRTSALSATDVDSPGT